MAKHRRRSNRRRADDDRILTIRLRHEQCNPDGVRFERELEDILSDGAAEKSLDASIN